MLKITVTATTTVVIPTKPLIKLFGIMKTTSTLMAVVVVLFLGCSGNTTGDDAHAHEESEALSYTLYSDKTELFVEFTPLIAGTRTSFATHVTLLGVDFLPMTEGKVTVSLVVGSRGIRSSADAPSSPGIFRLALEPAVSGPARLIFDIETDTFTDQIVIENLRVYPDTQAASEFHAHGPEVETITFLKEQAWNIEFATTAVQPTPFPEIIRTSGTILTSPETDRMMIAPTSGIVQFIGGQHVVGSPVESNKPVFLISGVNLADSNAEVRYAQAKNELDRTRIEFQRASQLVEDKIISESAFLQAKQDFDNAEVVFQSISRNYTPQGQQISSPIPGFITELMVTQGQFVQAGEPVARVSGQQSLQLQALVSLKHASKLPRITTASFKPVGSERVYTTEELKGRLLTYARSTSPGAAFLPVTFSITNPGSLVSGSMVEVYLKSDVMADAFVVPLSSIMEEQGNKYVFVQLGGESFEKREIQTGSTDGQMVQVTSGLNAGERVVSKGAYRIKLSSASGELPDHGHEH